tara:strand:- start:3425 stop:4054 length:630 start_codon:yes stop_codon:yes gene_type:complete
LLMQKSAEAFRSIGEVAKLIGVAPHVLRYWETQFPQLKPMKRPDGRRYYRPDDIRLVAGLCEVLRDDGMTIRGAKKLIAKDRGAAIRGRGAERLGEQVAAPGAPEATPRKEAAIAKHLIEMPDEPAPQDDPMPDHPPRARQRRRRQSGHDALPLFPDLSADAQATGWLAQLARLSVRLRAASHRDARWQQAATRAAALRGIIIAHYENT